MIGDATTPAVRFGHGASSFCGGAISVLRSVDLGIHFYFVIANSLVRRKGRKRWEKLTAVAQRSPGDGLARYYDPELGLFLQADTLCQSEHRAVHE
jgi:hypothetical protein